MLKTEDLQKFFDKSSSPHIGFKGSCHTCGEPVCVDMDMDPQGKVTITGGAIYKAQIGQTSADQSFFMKCDACYKRDPVLRQYQPCEVYSRVIGYLRPVSEWNDGKQAEYKLRKTFKMS
jgi:hypothetical protein